MKRKVIIKDFDGKVVEREFTVRDEEHFKAQLKFKSTITKNKKKYNRKTKHRGTLMDATD